MFSSKYLSKINIFENIDAIGIQLQYLRKTRTLHITFNL